MTLATERRRQQRPGASARKLLRRQIPRPRAKPAAFVFQKAHRAPFRPRFRGGPRSHRGSRRPRAVRVLAHRASQVASGFRFDSIVLDPAKYGVFSEAAARCFCIASDKGFGILPTMRAGGTVSSREQPKLRTNLAKRGTSKLR